MQKNDKQPRAQRFKKLFVASRPISWVNTAFPFAAGYLATGGTFGSEFVLATFYFLIPYNMLIYVVNDVYDYESDVRNPRKNSIEGGLLAPETHRFMLIATLLANLTLVPLLLSSEHAVSRLFLLLIAIGAVTYSMPPVRLKEKSFLDSINSSFHFVSPLVYALLLTGWKDAYWLYVGGFFLWGCASHAFGAVQDIKADRGAGISSIATFLGAKSTSRVSLILYVGSVASVLLAGWPAALVAAPLLLYVGMVSPYINLSDANCEQANKGWKRFLLLNQITGFVITVTLIVSGLL